MFTNTDYHRNTTTLSNYLYTLGVQIGHLYVEPYDASAYYIIGTRSFFTVSDISKTVPLIKSAVLFFEHVIQNFGNCLFSYSGIQYLNVHLKFFFSSLVQQHNQSFSY